MAPPGRALPREPSSSSRQLPTASCFSIRPNSAVRFRRTAPAARRSHSWRAIVPARPRAGDAYGDETPVRRAFPVAGSRTPLGGGQIGRTPTQRLAARLITPTGYVNPQSAAELRHAARRCYSVHGKRQSALTNSRLPEVSGRATSSVAAALREAPAPRCTCGGGLDLVFWSAFG
jgi:hypothetical protein